MPSTLLTCVFFLLMTEILIPENVPTVFAFVAVFLAITSVFLVKTKNYDLKIWMYDAEIFDADYRCVKCRRD